MRCLAIAISSLVLATPSSFCQTEASDIAVIKSRNGSSPGTSLDGEPTPDFRHWIEFTRLFHQSWSTTKSDDVQRAIKVPVDYLSIKDFRCKWGRPAFMAVDIIYLCPANVVWYSEIGTFSSVLLFAQARWNQGEPYAQYAGEHLFEHSFPLWRNEVVAGRISTTFPNSWMLLYCFRSNIPARDCNPRLHARSFDSWWQSLYDERERVPDTHIVRYWDVARQQFWLTIHFLLAHEAGHVALMHSEASSQVDIRQELEADRFAVRFLTAVGHSPLETLFTLQSLRYASSIVQRSSKSPVKDRLATLSDQMGDDIADLLKDNAFWSQVLSTFGSEATSAFKQALRAGEPKMVLPWERR